MTIIFTESGTGLTFRHRNAKSIVVTFLDGEETTHSAFKLSLDIHKKPGVMCTVEKKADWLRYFKGVRS
ncbi:hypothetical protein TNCV_1667951 [Trichonephila clavipes]|nr:hypothetical protein TNCV_1667951 [Trichonephila clavipes]